MSHNSSPQNEFHSAWYSYSELPVMLSTLLKYFCVLTKKVCVKISLFLKMSEGERESTCMYAHVVVIIHEEEKRVALYPQHIQAAVSYVI